MRFPGSPCRPYCIGSIRCQKRVYNTCIWTLSYTIILSLAIRCLCILLLVVGESNGVTYDFCGRIDEVNVYWTNLANQTNILFERADDGEFSLTVLRLMCSASMFFVSSYRTVLGIMMQRFDVIFWYMTMWWALATFKKCVHAFGSIVVIPFIAHVLLCSCPELFYFGRFLYICAAIGLFPHV